MPLNTNVKTQTSVRSDRGIALIAVVAFALIISILAVGVSRDTRLTTQIATEAIADARVDKAAEDGATWAALILAADHVGVPRPRSVAPFPSGDVATKFGTLWEGTIDEFKVQVTVQAERGKLDLMTANPGLLRQLFKSVGINRADQIVDHIITLRRSDEALVGWRIGNRPINALTEITADLDLSRDVLNRLREVATVESGLSEPDPLYAPEALFQVLELEDDERSLLVSLRAEPFSAALGQEQEVYTLICRDLSDGSTLTQIRRVVSITSDGEIRWLPSH